MIFNDIAKKEYNSVLEKLEKKPELLNTRDAKGNTPLHYAIEYGHDELAKKIIRLNPDLEVEGVDGFTPIQHAVSHGKADIVKLLIEKGANVNHKAKSGNSPFFIAFFRYKGDPSVLRLLMEANADPTLKNKHGNGVENLLMMPKNKDVAQEISDYLKSYDMNTEEE